MDSQQIKLRFNNVFNIVSKEQKLKLKYFEKSQ